MFLKGKCDTMLLLASDQNEHGIQFPSSPSAKGATRRHFLVLSSRKFPNFQPSKSQMGALKTEMQHFGIQRSDNMLLHQSSNTTQHKVAWNDEHYWQNDCEHSCFNKLKAEILSTCPKQVVAG